jgi:hypothetical protein
MPADPEDELRDETLRRVVAELRRPVPLDPVVERRALAEIRSPSPSRWPAWAGVAALAAGLALAVLRPERTDTRAVFLRLAAPASRVAVVGDFNDWDPGRTPLRPSADGGWMVELHLKPGRYHYTFLIDGHRWASDPSEPRAAESDFGAPMSVLTVS